MATKRSRLRRGLDFAGFAESTEGSKGGWSATEGGEVRSVARRVANRLDPTAVGQKMEAARKRNDGMKISKMQDGIRWIETVERHPEWPVNLKSMHQVVKVFSKFGVIEQVQRCFHILKERNLKPDPHLMLELMKALTTKNRREEAIAAYHIMQRRGVKPDIYTQTFLLHHSALDKRADDVEFFELEILQHKKLSAVAICSLINAFGKLKNTTKVLEYYDMFISQQLKQTTWTLSSMIDAFSRIERYEMVDKLYEEACKGNLELNPHLFSSMINTYADRKDIKSAEMAVDEMAKRGIRTNDIVMTAVLSVYAKCLEVEAAEDVFKSIASSGGDIGTIPSRIMLTMYAEAAESDKAIEFFKGMLKRGFKPKKRFYNLLLKCFANDGNIEGIDAYLGKMRRFNLHPDAEALSYGIIAHARATGGDLNSAVKFIELADETGVTMTDQMVRANMFALLRFGEIEHGIDELEKWAMTSSKPLPLEAYEFAAEAFAIRNELHEVVRFMVACDSFIKVDTKLLNEAITKIVKKRDIRIDPDFLVDQFSKVKKEADQKPAETELAVQTNEYLTIRQDDAPTP